jgi:transcriptional antiterminator NusG
MVDIMSEDKGEIIEEQEAPEGEEMEQAEMSADLKADGDAAIEEKSEMNEEAPEIEEVVTSEEVEIPAEENMEVIEDKEIPDAKPELEDSLEEVAEAVENNAGNDVVEDEPAEEVSEVQEIPVTEMASPYLEEVVEDSEEVVAEVFEEEPDDGRAWYVVHCYSGYENKVRHNLEQRIESMGMKEGIFDVVVPTEEEIEVKEGKRKTVERRVFPGYILVNMILTEESWYVVRNTPGVTSFVGQGNEPQALRPEEVSSIIKRMEADAPRIKVTFKQGERVRIVDGPFNDFRGTVDEIDMDRAKVRVMVNFFGRETPVELDFLQVEKA